MQSGKQRREVLSCGPCYTRKQKCDRRYPCTRCYRRRQPELCTYYSSRTQPAVNTTSLPLSLLSERSRDEDVQIGVARAETSWAERYLDESEHSDSFLASVNSQATPSTRSEASSSLAEAFGYFGQSDFNTMALVRKLVPDDDNPDANHIPLASEIEAEVRKSLDMMPGRQIIDFLVQYFVANVNWIDQLLYSPRFLAQYKRWWSLDSISSVAEIEFAILFLRACCYASQFLPSPAYTIDSVRGVPLADIRRSCEDAIDALAPICMRFDPRGSLVRVQHIAFAGLACISRGRMNAFWEHVSCATRVAQQIGLHLDTSVWASGMDEMEKEMGRRTFCNLYIWDSCLSKRLVRIPFLPDDGLSADIMPRMRLLPPDIDLGADAHDVFTERILRAKLALFWRQNSRARGSEPKGYDVVLAEERYETFCRTFLSAVPPVFALARPDRQWDEKLPTLPMQRLLLHMAIFEFLCWNFRPTLLQQADHHVRGYRQILIAHGKRALAVAALRLLESVSALHALMVGGSHTRFSGIILPTFEAAVPLLCLCADPSFPGAGGAGENGQPQPQPQHARSRESLSVAIQRMATDPLGARLGTVSRAECMLAARGALGTLQTLAELSEMADVGARTLARLIGRVESGSDASTSTLSPPLGGVPVQRVHDDFDSGGVTGHPDGGGGDVAMQQQAVADAISQWAFDADMRDFAGGGGGGGGSHSSSSQGDLAGGLGNSNLVPNTTEIAALGGATNWEDVLQNITDSFGFEDIAGVKACLPL